MSIFFSCECGKPFRTAEANAGRRMICTRCGKELGIPLLSGEPNEGIVFIETRSRICIKAVLSVLLAIASCLLGIFAGAPAVILGLMALSDIHKSQGRLTGKWQAGWGIALGCVGSLVILLLPAISMSREAPQRAQCVHTLKQIGLALSNYREVYGQFPPAASTDPQGKPLLSWRVAILPFVEGDELYSQFHLDEPWDSPHNRPLADKIPYVYPCPSDRPKSSGKTRYQLVVGPGSASDRDGLPTIERITDGSSDTLLVVEAASEVPWTKPDDLDIGQVFTGLGSAHPGGSNALFADGHVQFLKRSTSPAILRALATRAGGEQVSHDEY